MYASISSFLQTLSADSPILWAGFVVAVIAGTSLVLFLFWEVALKAISTGKDRSSTQ